MAVDLGDKNIVAAAAVTVAALAVAGIGGYFAYQQLLNNPRSVIFRPSAAENEPAPTSEPVPATAVGKPGASPVIKPAPAAKSLRPESAARLPPAVGVVPSPAAVPRPAEWPAQSVADALAPGADTTAPPEAVYGRDDRDVAPPVIVNARLGGQRLTVSPDRVLEIELVVNREGGVESVYIVPDSSATLSDAMLSTFALHAIRDWRFRPALRYGAPVRYRQSLWIRGNGEAVDRQ